MPYENYHACRLISPDRCKKGSFRTQKSTIDGKPVNKIFAKLNSTNALALQSMRFPKAHWTANQAKAKCRGTFEPAKK